MEMSALRRYPKQADTVKETTAGMEGQKCNAFGEKGVVAQRVFRPFFEGNVNIPGSQKRASKALHSRILNPIFLQSEVVIPEMQNGEKYMLCCNGFMALKCVR